MIEFTIRIKMGYNGFFLDAQQQKNFLIIVF